MEKISTRRRLKYGAKRVVAVSRQCWWRSIWRPHCPLPTLHSRERNAQAHTELGRTRGYHDRLVGAPSSSSTEESRRWTLRSSPQPSSLIRVTKSFSNCVYRVHVRHKSPPSRFRPMDGNGTKRNETERNGTERNGTERSVGSPTFRRRNFATIRLAPATDFPDTEICLSGERATPGRRCRPPILIFRGKTE